MISLSIPLISKIPVNPMSVTNFNMIGHHLTPLNLFLFNIYSMTHEVNFVLPSLLPIFHVFIEETSFSLLR